jgi:hypothetical protein
MSTISPVGAVIPVAAAGSLFAGFMSVPISPTLRYSSGAWLYDNGMSVLRGPQRAIFGLGVVLATSCR